MEENKEFNELEHIDGLKKIDLNPNDMLLISVDVGKMSPKQQGEYCKKIADNFLEKLKKRGLDSVEVIVYANTIDFSVLHIVEEPII
jgi:hypothetical protein